MQCHVRERASVVTKRIVEQSVVVVQRAEILSRAGSAVGAVVEVSVVDDGALNLCPTDTLTQLVRLQVEKKLQPSLHRSIGELQDPLWRRRGRQRRRPLLRQWLYPQILELLMVRKVLLLLLVRL